MTNLKMKYKIDIPEVRMDIVVSRMLVNLIGLKSIQMTEMNHIHLKGKDHIDSAEMN